MEGLRDEKDLATDGETQREREDKGESSPTGGLILIKTKH